MAAATGEERDLRFVEIWRVGGTNEGEELALPIALEPGPDGQVAIVDLELGAVGVASDGRWLGPLTKRGAGPGEVEFPVAAAWREDGALVVLDVGAGKVIFVSPDDALPGRLIEETKLDPSTMAEVIRSGQIGGVGLASTGVTYLQRMEPMPQEGLVTQRLLRLRPDGSTDTVSTVSATALRTEWRPGQSLVAPGYPRLVVDVAADGTIAMAGTTDEYVVRVFGPRGDVTVCRSVPGHALREDELEPGMNGVPADEDPFRAAADRTPKPEHPAPIGRLLLGREGRLWVERDRPSVANPIEFQVGRPGSTYDVFDTEGRRLGSVRAPEGVRLVAAAGTRVWGFATGEYDVTWVVSYRLEGRGFGP